MATEMRTRASLLPVLALALTPAAGADLHDLAFMAGCWLQDGRDVVFAVGGPDGLAPPVVERAEWRWSLSPLTLPHGLVRVVLAEQLYRAWTVLQGHPYHRA